jgi:tRNA (adenine57-N1/adenine58-N1)-methyltransferase catalytic subunit
MKSYIVVLRPNTHMYTTSLMQRTQILYTPDISMIVSRLGLRPGSKVVESGTGSGSLSVSMTKSIFPRGHLFTFEFNKMRVEKAGKDF